MPEPWKLGHMNMMLGTGEWDNTRHESMRMSAILDGKGAALAGRPQMVRARLELLARHAAVLFVKDLTADFADSTDEEKGISGYASQFYISVSSA